MEEKVRARSCWSREFKIIESPTGALVGTSFSQKKCKKPVPLPHRCHDEVNKGGGGEMEIPDDCSPGTRPRSLSAHQSETGVKAR